MYPIVVNGTDNNSTGKHVRCYCNLPPCVTTGYMCKSPSGGCFSELLSDVNRARHGCIETLENGDHKAKCMNSPSESAVRASAGVIGAGQASAAFVLCCFRDLCNHVDNPQSRLRLNDTLAAGNNALVPPVGPAGTNNNHTNEIWFRAATIAVPICGALILFSLIAFAVKMLRTDAMDAANKLSATHTPHGVSHGALEVPLMKKGMIHRENANRVQSPAAPLLFSNTNVMNICETNHTKNELSNKNPGGNSCDCKDDNCIIMQHYPPILQHSSPIHKLTNSKPNNKDVNINVVSSKGGDATVCVSNKMYEKQLLPLNDKLYNKDTIIYWGQAAANANQCPR